MGDFSASRKRNVKPVSSVLNVTTRDVDCSALATAPADGSFVTLSGTRGTADLDKVSYSMVWGSALRSDRQALGDRRVSVLAHGGIEVECALYIAGNDAVNLDAPGNFPVGTLVQASAIEDDDNNTLQLALAPLAAEGWAVGFVTAAPSALPANDRAITVYLYDKPMHVSAEASQ